MRSFTEPIEQGILTLVDTFLDHKDTILVPTFSDQFLERPTAPYMPKQNGVGDYSYFLNNTYDETKIFNPNCKDITTEEMGTFPTYILNCKDSKRGNHMLNSFTALGPNAAELISGQTAIDVYAPLKQLYQDDGYVLLMGVGLESATILHYAEQVAGRTPFIRWAFNDRKQIIPVSAGSCSEGFNRLAPFVEPYKKSVTVGGSVWQCYRARDLVDICAAEIRRNPMITHCGDKECERCNDAVLGGPIIAFE
ncbi:MAG: AAC(3) family N-acetyltransferase [bacterium]|nr:AAC(3) family N-acetyltransferase [bacterium]